jgi:hypothetical protein
MTESMIDALIQSGPVGIAAAAVLFWKYLDGRKPQLERRKPVECGAVAILQEMHADNRVHYANMDGVHQAMISALAELAREGREDKKEIMGELRRHTG